MKTLRASEARAVALNVLLGALLVACSSPSPTATLTAAFTPTSTHTPVPTATPAPPKATTAPTPVPPTATHLPPTDTPISWPSPTPETKATPRTILDVPSEEVSFLTEDGIDIAGTLFGEGDITVIFLHQGRGSVTQNSWKPFARLAAGHGFAALTLDFRGRGKSGGSVHESSLPKDARAAVEFLRDRGYTRIVCIGAGMWGGWPCTLLAIEGSIEGFAVLSSPMTVGPTGSVSVEELAALTMPKLYVYGAKDYEGVAENMAEVYRVSAEPKEQVVYDSSARGTNLFRSPFADDLTQQLLGFLNGIRAP